MAAELGESADPKALIPGDPDAIEINIRKIREYGERLESVGDNLKRIDVGNWSGQASVAFVETFSKEPPKWLKVTDSLNAVARSLTDYSGMLRWAQSQAKEAIELWEKGDKAAAEGGRPANSGGAGTGPEEKLHAEARALLERARGQLDEAGGRTARAISGNGGDGGALAEMVDAVTSGWESKGKAEVSGPGAGIEMSGSGKGGKLGEIKAYAELAKASAEGTVQNDLFKLSGKAEASVDAAATASASFNQDGFTGKLDASAGAKASAEGRAEMGIVGASGKVEGLAGARAGAEASLGKDGLNLGADAFAGAKATAEAGADVGGIGVSGTAEGWAGAGAEAGVDFGMNESGKFEIGANVGAAVGLGGQAGFQVTVDPAEVGKTVSGAADSVGGAVDAVGDAAGSAQKSISGWLD